MEKQKFIEQLKKLVGFATLSGNIEQNAKALDYIETLIDKQAFIKRFKNKKAEILIASNTKISSPLIGYMVHVDVVAGKPEQFILKQKGDKLFGRGAEDMKFSIPIGIQILNDLIKQRSKLTFTLAITTDEEIGGFEGAAYLAENLKFRPECLVVPDGGENLNFVEKAKGVCQIIITSKGFPAHASKPWEGKNALEPIVKLAAKLIAIYGKGSLKENWNTTMNIGQIQGGISTNQVCPEATMKLDFRYPETDSIEKILGRVRVLAKKISPKLSIAPASTGLPTFTDVALPVVKSFLTAMGKAYGKRIFVAPTYGASDARHFAKYNIPVLMMEPIGANYHADDEWVSLSSCLKFYEGLRLFINNYYTTSL
jgi:succinyl-diaminopimelate desuccinylase